MRTFANINEPIVETLYVEALVLADEVRSAFDLPSMPDDMQETDELRLALSVEGLRTTTRMMHLLAWLLNYRAYFAGDLSDTQRLQHSRLPVDREPDDANLALLEPETRAMIAQSVQLHSRVARLDAEWCDRDAMAPVAVHSLQKSIGAR